MRHSSLSRFTTTNANSPSPAAKLNGRKWEFTKLPVTTGWDSHNYITMTVDDGGFLHLSGDMHCVPLKYFRTTKPLDPATFERLDKMTGTEENRTTYPRFMRGSGTGTHFHLPRRRQRQRQPDLQCLRSRKSGHGNACSTSR